ncbi:MAG: hypothetical protein MRJ93_03960 [Nitrososphaeraceae archaeon]|nr:hypothetical protein [Nitrososphaeraceae archaeon]
MKSTKILYLISGGFVFFGILFIAQSQSFVGPTQSFMYDNPEWEVNGSILLSIGILIFLSALTMTIWKNKRT